MHLFLAALELRCCASFSPVVVSVGYSLVAAHRLLVVVASLVAEHGLHNVASGVVAHGFSCPVACGIFLDQGLNPFPLHWQADF